MARWLGVCRRQLFLLIRRLVQSIGVHLWDEWLEGNGSRGISYWGLLTPTKHQ